MSAGGFWETYSFLNDRMAQMWLTLSFPISYCFEEGCDGESCSSHIATKGKDPKGGGESILSVIEFLNQWKQPLTCRHFVA